MDELAQTRSGNGEPLATPSLEGESAMVCAVCAASYVAGTRYCSIDGSLLRPALGAQDDLIGKVVDSRYYLLEKLGEGGMGNVYLGEHLRTRRRCAVKVISRLHAGDPEALSRFIREATNAGRINHPHVATLYDFGEAADGVAYIAMEYVEGEPLSNLLAREGAVPAARAVEIARQVAEGVAAAHELGIVHRDLKPGNILIAKDRKGADLVKVVDFGIARAPADAEQDLTRTGFIIGTPEYMSPEQLIGDPVDGRSDIYSLGCILYQMLTGEHAFSGAFAQVVTRRLNEPPPRPREKNPDIPKALDELIGTALCLQPYQRFQTMEAMRDAMLAAPAQPVTTGPRRLAAWMRGRRDAQTAVASPSTQPSQPVAAAAAPQTNPEVTQKDEPVLVGEAEPENVLEEVSPEPTSADPDPDVDAPLTETTPRRRLPMWPPGRLPGRLPMRAVAIAASVAILLVTGFSLFSGRESRAAQEPPVVTPIPLPQLDDSVLTGLWSELKAAELEDEAEQYVLALGRLQSAETRGTALLAAFPAHPGLLGAVDSTRAQITLTKKRCEASRTVAIGRGQPAPQCNPDESAVAAPDSARP
jgi:serine/threonine protein kinase